MKRYRWVLAVSLLIFAVALGAPAEDTDVVRLGIVTDVHAHDMNSPEEEKVMVNWVERVEAFVDSVTAWPADVIISLGDYVNGRFVMAGDVDLGDPERIEAIFQNAYATLTQYNAPVHYVVGNHDVYDLSKEQILAVTGTESTYYSFDLGGFHFVILDAQFDKNENDYNHIAWMVQGLIPTIELDWLRADLAASDLPTLVLVHQPLDSDFDLYAGGPPVFNHRAVRDVLAADGDVIAVFQGHDHDNVYRLIDGIHYVTFAAMVDHTVPGPPTWAQVTLDPEARTIMIEGFGLQESYELLY